MLLAALVCCAVGLAWLALAMDVHWRQVRGPQPPSRTAVTTLRVLGAGALLLSLVLCFVADHASMAPLVWVMALAGGALIVAFTLAWRPRLLAPLVVWIPGN
jgi:hypothetical protein